MGDVQTSREHPTSGGIQSWIISSCITVHLILPIYVNYSIIKYIDTLLIWYPYKFDVNPQYRKIYWVVSDHKNILSNKEIHSSL